MNPTKQFETSPVENLLSMARLRILFVRENARCMKRGSHEWVSLDEVGTPVALIESAKVKVCRTCYIGMDA